MNTNDAQYLDNGFIPVRKTNRADTTCWKPTIDYNSRQIFLNKLNHIALILSLMQDLSGTRQWLLRIT